MADLTRLCPDVGDRLLARQTDRLVVLDEAERPSELNTCRLVARTRECDRVPSCRVERPFARPDLGVSDHRKLRPVIEASRSDRSRLPRLPVLLRLVEVQRVAAVHREFQNPTTRLRAQ